MGLEIQARLLPRCFRYDDSAINSPGMRPSPPDELRLLGKGIKQLRRKHRLTQQELSKRCNIHSQFLGGIERGTENPTLDILGRIAKALGVPLPDLFSSAP